MKEIRLRLSDPAHAVIKEKADADLRTFQGQAQFVLEAYAAGDLVQRSRSGRPSKPVFAYQPTPEEVKAGAAE